MGSRVEVDPVRVPNGVDKQSNQALWHLATGSTALRY